MKDTGLDHSEQQRRELQEYIFDLEEIQEEAEELSFEHEQLKHSQDLLTAILSATKSGIILVKNHKISWCNRGFTEMFGWGQEEIVRKTPELLYSTSEEYIRTGHIMYDKLSRNQFTTFEYDFVHKDGYRVPCLATGCALDENDLSRGDIFSFTDISMQKRAEERLRESEEHFRALSEYSLDTIMRFDRAHCHLYVNPAVERFTGIPVKEFIGKTHAELGFPDHLVTFWEKAIDTVFESGAPHRVEFELPHHIWIDWMLIPEFSVDGNIRTVITSARDITARKRTEEALQRERDLAKALEEATAALTGTLDFEQVLDRILEQVSRVVPNDAADIMLLEGDDAHMVRWRGYGSFEEAKPIVTRNFCVSEIPNFQQMVSSKRAILVSDVENDPDWIAISAQRWMFSYAAAPIISRDEVIGFLNVTSKTSGFFTQAHVEALRAFAQHAAAAIENAKLYEMAQQELTERTRAEEELRRAYHDLENVQTQLIQSAKLASIGELAAGVAHELNQPLMVIRTTIQFLQRSLRKGSLEADQLATQFDSTERNTRRMTTIINHLRTFSRQSQMELSLLDINAIIEDSFLMVGEQLRLRGIEVKKHLSPHLSNVRGDANQLEQVFLNLITNARDAIETQETKERGNIEIITRMSGDDTEWVEILVKDTGSGISGNHLEKVFDPFFTSKDVGKGTGLGLSISYGIIKDHQGEIEVTETGPEGTTFRVKLPVLSED